MCHLRGFSTGVAPGHLFCVGGGRWERGHGMKRDGEVHKTH